MALFTTWWTVSEHICPDCQTTIQDTVSALNTSLFPSWKKAGASLSNRFSDGLWWSSGELVPDTDSWNGLSSVSTVVKNSTPERVRCQRNKQAKNTTAFIMNCKTEPCQWLQHQTYLIVSFFSEVEVHKPYIAIS